MLIASRKLNKQIAVNHLLIGAFGELNGPRLSPPIWKWILNFQRNALKRRAAVPRDMSSIYQRVGTDEDLELGRIPTDTTKDNSMVDVRIAQVGSSNKTVQIDLDWTTETFKRSCFPEEHSSGKNIRVIYQGKQLENSTRLSAAGVKPNVFIHVSITEPRRTSEVDIDSHTGEEVDLERDRALAEELQLAMGGGNGLEGFVQRDGNIVDFAVGFCLGLLLGPLMLMWVFQPRITRMQRKGILAGVLFRIIYRFQNANEHAVDTSRDDPAVTPP